jgi:hypothetical protein
VPQEEEGLHGVFKRLRRNGHQLKKEAANSCPGAKKKKKRGYTVCSSGYATTDTS